MLELKHQQAIIASMAMEYVKDEIMLDNDEEIIAYDFLENELKHGGNWKIYDVEETVVRKALANFKEDFDAFKELMDNL